MAEKKFKLTFDALKLNFNCELFTGYKYFLTFFS